MSQTKVGGEGGGRGGLFTGIDCSLESGVACLNLGLRSGILACEAALVKVRARNCVTPAAAAEKSFRATTSTVRKTRHVLQRNLHVEN